MHHQNSSGLVCRIREFLQGCGFKVHKEGTGMNGIRAVPVYGFHSCRHTFVSICRTAGVPDAVIQSVVGKSYPIYTHIGIEAQRKAVNSMPSATCDQGVPAAALPEGENLTDEEIPSRIEALEQEAERRGLSARKPMKAA